jgi:hypothetical protein
MKRQQLVRARAGLLPAFAHQCSAIFARAKDDEVAPELCKIAVGQLRATATFYREDLRELLRANETTGDDEHERSEGDLGTRR